jgi:hypothetical protein
MSTFSDDEPDGSSADPSNDFDLGDVETGEGYFSDDDEDDGIAFGLDDVSIASIPHAQTSSKGVASQLQPFRTSEAAKEEIEQTRISLHHTSISNDNGLVLRILLVSCPRSFRNGKCVLSPRLQQSIRSTFSRTLGLLPS